MKKLYLRLLPLALLALAALLACNMTSQTPSPVDSAAIYTQAAQTLVAQLTGSAPFASPTAQVPSGENSGAQPTSTLLPPTLLPTSTLPPVFTNTPAPTITPLPPTNTPQPTAVPAPCNLAKFVEDVTVPDNTRFDPQAEFTKIWRLQNIGSCTWTPDYALVFVSGDRMSGASAVEIDKTVRPGERADVSVELIAPDDAGKYRGNWMLSDPDGEDFGLGQGANNPFYVQIRVNEAASQPVEEGLVYSFVSGYCSADWESGVDNSLPCPGEEGSADGFVVRLGEHVQENQVENEPALWTNPDRNPDGFISGEFPAVKIEAGDKFLADVGCLADNQKCNVTFLLQYRIGDSAVKTLEDWQEVYDGKITRIQLDLSQFAGQSVRFILTVKSNGGRQQNAAFWLMPHIYRP
jgi:hypothetical protein